MEATEKILLKTPTLTFVIRFHDRSQFSRYVRTLIIMQENSKLGDKQGVTLSLYRLTRVSGTIQFHFFSRIIVRSPVFHTLTYFTCVMLLETLFY